MYSKYIVIPSFLGICKITYLLYIRYVYELCMCKRVYQASPQGGEVGMRLSLGAAWLEEFRLSSFPTTVSIVFNMWTSCYQSFISSQWELNLDLTDTSMHATIKTYKPSTHTWCRTCSGLLRLESKKIFIALANRHLAGKFDRELNFGLNHQSKIHPQCAMM